MDEEKMIDRKRIVYEGYSVYINGGEAEVLTAFHTLRHDNILEVITDKRYIRLHTWRFETLRISPYTMSNGQLFIIFVARIVGLRSKMNDENISVNIFIHPKVKPEEILGDFASVNNKW